MEQRTIQFFGEITNSVTYKQISLLKVDQKRYRIVSVTTIQMYNTVIVLFPIDNSVICTEMLFVNTFRTRSRE